jgi:hypothetical protein
MEGYFSTKSLSYRNHNPGNIERPDGTFKQYADVATGWQGLVTDIQANVGKTLTAFIYRYAPPSENDSATYLAVVSSLSGIGPQESL